MSKKTNNPTASLRQNRKLKPEAVRTLSLKDGKNAIEFAKKQNTMSDGQLAQLPAGRKHKSTTSSGN